MDTGFFKINGLEEGKSHQMVPMGMGYDHRVVVPAFCKQAISKHPQT
jgi:hypothetical protein